MQTADFVGFMGRRKDAYIFQANFLSKFLYWPEVYSHDAVSLSSLHRTKHSKKVYRPNEATYDLATCRASSLNPSFSTPFVKTRVTER